MPNYNLTKDITGLRSGKLVAVRPTDQRKWECVIWELICDCGNTRYAVSWELRGKHPLQSCGCGKRKAIRTTRGVPHAIYNLWKSMMDRCYYPKNPSYHNYAERGITVAEEWHDPVVFYRDIGPRPSLGHSVERKDNNGNYCKENCEWATRSQQMRNTRQNHWITAFGQTRTDVEWTEISGHKKNVIRSRLRYGWPPEQAIALPVHSRIKSHSGIHKLPIVLPVETNTSDVN